MKSQTIAFMRTSDFWKIFLKMEGEEEEEEKSCMIKIFQFLAIQKSWAKSQIAIKL